jgi:superfamily II DNA or RNA helicase
MYDKDSIILESLYEVVVEGLHQDENSKKLVKADAILRLRKAVNDMAARGVPNEFNDLGFNKIDWTTIVGGAWGNGLMQAPEFNMGDEMPVWLIQRLMGALYKYRSTQLKSIGFNWDGEEKVLRHEINKVTNTQQQDEDKIVFDYSNTQYGKILVTVPKIKSGKRVVKEEYPSINRINKEVIYPYFQEQNIPKVIDNYGNYVFQDSYKYFKKLTPSQFYMVPELARRLAEKIYPDVEIKEIGNLPARGQGEEEAPVNKPKVEIVSAFPTKYGRKLEVNLGPTGSPVSKKVYFACKNAGLTPKLLSFDMASKKIFMDDKKSSYELLKPIFEQDLDVSDLEKHFGKEEAPVGDGSVEEVKPESGDGYLLNVEYVAKQGIRLAPNYASGIPEDAKKVFRECIRYLFPTAKWENYMANLKGDYEQYVKLGQILKDNNFNVDNLRIVFKKMKEDGILKPARDLKLKKQEQVSEATDNDFPESGFKLFGLQKEGVDFLYKNKYAILGSETGGGKTVQMIYAAELVYKEEKKPILIVTLKRVQSQFAEEIVAVMGEKERKEISVDPMVTKKWNVLYYENFSAGGNLEGVINHLSNQEYSVVIFDELHKLKHSTSKRSQNLEKIAEKAKCRWGATATVSANKPMDVKNQLAILGHPMGLLDDSKFKREFAGMVPAGYGGAYVEGDFEDRIRAAEHLNKWMHLTGIYIRHSKEDMRSEKGEKMPDIKIDKEKRNSIKKQAEFIKQVNDKIKGYKDPNLAISQMLAFRDIIAKEKTDETIRMAMDIIVNNQKDKENNYSASKVLIFTNFVGAGQELLSKAEEALASVNPKWKAYSFLSSTPKKELDQVKKKMEHPDAKILVMSMKMGGTGISFPNTFKTMIVNDYDWTPESVEQSEGRIYRINTNQNVRVIYNINPGGDERLYENVEKKKKLAEIIQTYRKIYQQEKISDQDSEALQKIIDAQKKLAEVEGSDLDIIADELGGAIKESFAKYFRSKY